MANAKLKAAREAYRRDKKRNPYGLYLERYMDWHIAIPSNAVEALVGNADFQRATKAEVVTSADKNGLYTVKLICTADDFTKLISFLKKEKVRGEYCLNDPGYTWKSI